MITKLQNLKSLGCKIIPVDQQRLGIEFKSEKFSITFNCGFNPEDEVSISGGEFCPYALGIIVKQPDVIEQNWISSKTGVRVCTDRYPEFLSEENPLMIFKGKWKNRYFIISKDNVNILLSTITKLVETCLDYEQTH